MEELDKIELACFIRCSSDKSIYNDYVREDKELIRLTKEVDRLNNIILELSEKNRNLLEDNMRLRKELNLHGGKLYISDIEVKKVWVDKE